MTPHLVRDSAVLLKRSLRHVLRSPDTILTTAITPIAMLLLFVYVLGGAIEVGEGRYVDYLLPGILLITVASGIAYTALRLFLDVSGGIFDTVPVDADRPGRPWPVGPRADLRRRERHLARARGPGSPWRWASAPAPACSALARGSLGLLLVFTLALTWLAVIPGLTATTVDGVSGFSYPLVFLPFISSAFVPTAGMPGPVRWFAEHQPVTSIVDTLRNLYAEQPLGDEGWIAAGWCAGLLLVAYALAMTTYRRKLA
jgi:ABC-2 type transport system permease protein